MSETTGAVETQRYSIPGQRLGWRVSQLQQQGYPYQVHPAGGGIYIVIVRQPQGVNPFAYQPPHQPQVWPRWDGARVLQWVAVIGVVAILLGTVYMVFARGEGEQPFAAATSNIWDWFDGLRLPWESEPAMPAPIAPAAEPGFKWPWDSAAESAAAAAESVQGTVTVVSASILAALVLMIVLALVRKAGGR